MTTTAKGTLDVTDWMETSIAEAEGQSKQAAAQSEAAFSGDLQGRGRCDWLLVYPGEGPARFVGTQRFEGELSGRKGSFVLLLRGTFDATGAHVTWEVSPGSGSGELVGLGGTGGYENADYTLEFTLE
ncbi:DUF3224 domain-containing protein [Streptomyces sp. SID161]|uniref:DUF3224 domain-containing protein n=1 Tax=Streptomyces sp. SID161 TaxID=2690251 RepID=UPI001370EC27|nr:DUF3224 domain-containing protein [Streptomyces sp. SID161]MYW42448.1 DUF3224 domain-containing protein [Streptomyces sp. SID161]